MEPIVIWDLDDEPDGNASHIAEHGVTKEEVEQILQNEDNETDASASSGRPITFGRGKSVQRKTARSPEEAARLRELDYPCMLIRGARRVDR